MKENMTSTQHSLQLAHTQSEAASSKQADLEQRLKQAEQKLTHEAKQHETAQTALDRISTEFQEQKQQLQQRVEALQEAEEKLQETEEEARAEREETDQAIVNMKLELKQAVSKNIQISEELTEAHSELNDAKIGQHGWSEEVNPCCTALCDALLPALCASSLAVPALHLSPLHLSPLHLSPLHLSPLHLSLPHASSFAIASALAYCCLCITSCFIQVKFKNEKISKLKSKVRTLKHEANEQEAQNERAVMHLQNEITTFQTLLKVKRILLTVLPTHCAAHSACCPLTVLPTQRAAHSACYPLSVLPTQRAAHSACYVAHSACCSLSVLCRSLCCWLSRSRQLK